MTDLRQAAQLALEALEDERYVTKYTHIVDAITAIREALAQPEQEPVAWMFQHEETGRIMCVEAQQVEWGFEKGNPRLKKIAPLYTTPPASQRKPLTPAEIAAFVGTHGFGPEQLKWFRYAEAAHGIKEGT